MPSAVKTVSPMELLPAPQSIRAGARWAVEVGEVVVIEPDDIDVERLGRALRRLGLRVAGFSNPWRALAHRSQLPVVLVIASARLGADPLRGLVEAVREEMDLPVLIAFDPDDTQTIGPAVLAGGRPLLTLPYDVDEVARVVDQASQSVRPPQPWGLGRLSMVPEGLDARFDGIGLGLSPLEFAILGELARYGGRAMSQEALVTAAWPYAPTNPKSVLVAAIKRLRRKFAALGVCDVVETVRGVGYRLNARVLTDAKPTDPQRSVRLNSATNRSTRHEISSTIRRTS